MRLRGPATGADRVAAGLATHGSEASVNAANLATASNRNFAINSP